MFESQKPQISHHYDIDVLQWSRSGRVARSQLAVALAQSSSCEKFSKKYTLLHISKKSSTFAGRINKIKNTCSKKNYHIISPRQLRIS